MGGIDYDKRWYVTGFEVHFWPHLGRVMAIHLVGMGDEPIVTDLRMVGMGDAVTATHDGSLLIALALAGAAIPAASTIVRHDSSGGIVSVDVQNMSETPV